MISLEQHTSHFNEGREIELELECVALVVHRSHFSGGMRNGIFQCRLTVACLIDLVLCSSERVKCVECVRA